MRIGSRVRVVVGESVFGLEGEIRDGVEGRVGRPEGDWLVSVPNEGAWWFFESELEEI